MTTEVVTIRPTGLYRCYNADGVLLYVGVTFSPDIRFGDHSDKKDWWPEVRRIDLTWFDDRAEAEAAEIAAMLAEKPLWNRRDSPWRTAMGSDGELVVVAKPERNPSTGTDRQSFRYDPEKWRRFIELAEPNGSAVLQQFMDWQIGETGAARPRRPTPSRT